MRMMTKLMMTACMLQVSALAETNGLIEVKLFKTWVIQGERNFGNLAIKNTGTDPILLAKDPVYFGLGQLAVRLPRDIAAKTPDSMREQDYREITEDSNSPGFFELPSNETHVYEGRKFYLPAPFTGDPFIVSIYLGGGFWLDSEPLTVKGVSPDSNEFLAKIDDGLNLHIKYELRAITYKNERWLYKRLLPDLQRKREDAYSPTCPLSLSSTIRVEPHEGFGIYKIWDGDKPMIYDLKKGMLLEGPDENNVFGKWTRERKQKADADNAEIRRKKVEEK